MDRMGERLRLERQRKNWTMERLGEMIGVRKNTISQYEHGKRTPSLDVIRETAAQFDVSLDYLVGLSDDPDPRRDQRNLREILEKDRLHYDGIYLAPSDLEPIRAMLKVIASEARHRNASHLEEHGQELATV